MTDTSLIDVVTPADPWAGRPSLSRGVVPRPRLVAALASTGPGCVAVLAAPAGYGKTTLLCQWEAADARRFAWLGLDSRDDELHAHREPILEGVERQRRQEPLFSGITAPVVAEVD